MIIPEYALKNFEIQPDDDEQTILLKNYYLSRNKISKQWGNDEELKKQQNFNKKYDALQKMKKNTRTSIQELQIRAALDELLNL